jgi:predicted O-linked N-acetylglucosamine transferase (SPINDLY family)
VTAWGHATGTGLATMDYFFSDPVHVPPEERKHFAEEVFDLPCCICYEAPSYAPEVSPLPALAGKPLTFGCINRIEKITDKVIGLWARILQAVPGAQLLIKGPALDEPKPREALRGRLSELGIAPERVRLVGSSPHAEHLKIFHEIDIGLDPYPQGGGVSTAEALWMGVPVVTLQGSVLPSRISASFLSVLQMQDWVAASEKDYVRIAVEAARDLPRLAALRGQLRGRMAGTVLGDPRRYTRAVEAAYRTMWQRWCGFRSKKKNKKG